MSKINVVGDVRYSAMANELFANNELTAIEFLQKLQELMKEYGVVKLDVCLDAFTIDISSK